MIRGIVANLWLIPAVPLAASLIILSLANSRRNAAATLAIFGQIVALASSILAFSLTLQTHGFRSVHNFTWFTFGENGLRIGWVLDPLAAAMLVMIALVGLCIFVFSVGYMAEDKNFTRFFAYLSFFSGAMLGVVVANSLLFLFVCWELVGLASYLLIVQRLQRKRHSSPLASVTWDFFSAFSGSTAAVAHCSFMMAAAVALKIQDSLRSVLAPHLSRY
ncbi:MAG: hypothetical protein DME68_09760 [Verrucomicrobia bacterium]|nr:MAG: hypothetical protein DME68_09760 [Verrucomicrobiota bacterium]